MKRKLFKTISAAALIMLLCAAFTACGGGAAFNGKGAAEINITMDGDYPGISVQCPNGTVTAGAAVRSWNIAVRSSALTDVIISCEGYETKTITFKTDELKTGTVTRDNVSLTKKKRLVNLTITNPPGSGLQTADGLGFDIFIGGSATYGLITGKTVNNKQVTLELSEIPKVPFEVKVSGTGYRANSVEILPEDFVNYKASCRVPLLASSDKRIAVTLFNDFRTGWPNYYIMSYPYDEETASGSCTGTSVIYLDGSSSYKVYSGTGNGKTAYLAQKDFAANPYKSVRMSEIYDTAPGSGNYWVNIQFTSVFGERQYLRIYDNATGEKLLDQNAGIENLGNIKIGDKLRILYIGAGLEKSLISHYLHTVTAANVGQNFSGGYRERELTIITGKRDVGFGDVYINLVDEDGAGALYGGDAEILYGGDEVTTKAYAGLDGISTSRVKIDLDQVLNSVSVGSSPVDFRTETLDEDYVADLNWITWAELMDAGAAGMDVTLRKLYDLNIRFSKYATDEEKNAPGYTPLYLSFEFLSNNGGYEPLDRDANGYYPFKAADGKNLYAKFENTYDGTFKILLVDMYRAFGEEGAPDRYKQLGRGDFKAFRNFFEETTPGSYYFTIEVYKEKKVGVTFTPSNANVQANVNNIYGYWSKDGGASQRYLSVSWVSFDEIFVIDHYEHIPVNAWRVSIDESMVGTELSFSITLADNSIYEGRVTLTATMFNNANIPVSLTKISDGNQGGNFGGGGKF